MADNVKVAVRMRPFNSRETGMSAKCCVRMVKETQQTVLVEPDSGPLGAAAACVAAITPHVPYITVCLFVSCGCGVAKCRQGAHIHV